MILRILRSPKAARVAFGIRMLLPASKGVMRQVSGQALILGCGLSSIDEKGRVALPPDLRNAVIANSEDRIVYISKHPEGDALVGYDAATLQETLARIQKADDALAASGDQDRDFGKRRRNFPRTEPAPFDASGRFTLSGPMKGRGKLDDLAFFYGLGDIFEIWNPRDVLADPNADPELQEEIRWAMTKKGIL